MPPTLKDLQTRLGVLLYEYIFYECLLRGKNGSYMMIRNRNERLARGPKKLGYVCLWPYTSRLHAPIVWPWLGKRLLEVAIRSNDFASSESRDDSEDIDISILIGHRGLERIAHLLTTLKFIAAQSDVKLECIVVEQDCERRIEKLLPAWVRYTFQKSDGGSDTYNRSAAFNCGAMIAKGRILLLHDNDMIIPTDYCQGIRDIINEGYDAVNTKRFVFYLNAYDSADLMKYSCIRSDYRPEYIVQNLEAGGSVAITKIAYIQIGGMDEAFIGWGGEDNEFWTRCKVLKRWIWGFSPIIHLWHRSQPLKNNKENINVKNSQLLACANLDERILELRSKNRLGVFTRREV